MSKAGSDSSGISSSSHDGSKSGTDSDYNTEPSIISAISSSFMPKRVVAILYSRDSNCKAYNYHKVAGYNFLIDMLCPQTQRCEMNTASLNEHMVLNLNEYMFLK